MGEGARDHEPAFEAAGERARAVMAALPQPEFLQVLLGALAGEGPVDPVVPRLVHDDIDDRLELREIDLLGHEPDLRLGRLERGVGVVPIDPDAARGLVDEAGDDPDRGRFARAVRAEQREEVAGPNGEVDAVECLPAVAVGLPKPADLEGIGLGKGHCRMEL